MLPICHEAHYPPASANSPARFCIFYSGPMISDTRLTFPVLISQSEYFPHLHYCSLSSCFVRSRRGERFKSAVWHSFRDGGDTRQRPRIIWFHHYTKNKQKTNKKTKTNNGNPKDGRGRGYKTMYKTDK